MKGCQVFQFVIECVNMGKVVYNDLVKYTNHCNIATYMLHNCYSTLYIC